jgi:hypothetical protein
MASGLLQELLPVSAILPVHWGVSGLRDERTAILHVLNGERAPEMSPQEVCGKVGRCSTYDKLKTRGWTPVKGVMPLLLRHVGGPSTGGGPYTRIFELQDTNP